MAFYFFIMKKKFTNLFFNLESKLVSFVDDFSRIFCQEIGPKLSLDDRERSYLASCFVCMSVCLSLQRICQVTILSAFFLFRLNHKIKINLVCNTQKCCHPCLFVCIQFYIESKSLIQINYSQKITFLRTRRMFQQRRYSF